LHYISPCAVLCGIISLIVIYRQSAALRGMNYAIAGIVLGVISSWMVSSQLPMLSHRGPFMSGALLDKCDVNRQKLAKAVKLYCHDHNGYFPPVKSWNEAIAPYIDKKYLICPAADNQQVPSYAMNSKLEGAKYDSIKNPDETVLFFEIEPGYNKSGTKVLRGSRRWHFYGHGFAFVDGSIRTMCEWNSQQ
jgi:hypothetical protein